MKNLLLFFFITITLISFSCSDKSTVTSPVQSVQDQEPNWLVSIPSNSSTLKKLYSASELIDGSKGGHVDLNEEISGGPFGKINVVSKLEIKPGSFMGIFTISTDIDDEHLLTTFSPSYIFDIPLEYTLSIEGIDLTGIDPKHIDFVYQAEDGSIYPCEYKKIEIDVKHGKIKVEKAKLGHFSRYGWSR